MPEKIQKLISLPEAPDDSLSEKEAQAVQIREKITDDVLNTQLRKSVELSFDCDRGNPESIDINNLTFHMMRQNGDTIIFGEIGDGREIAITPFFGEDFDAYFMDIIDNREKALDSFLGESNHLFSQLNGEIN